ncbi:MAG: MipA/OmpV family protein [Pseudomonadales bacterium]|nr:MipA/OmpV family protein [Pseudomonadales bacterium]
MQYNKLFLGLTLVPMLISTPALAGEFTLGLGAYTAKSEYKDLKNSSGAVPLIEYQGQGWSVSPGGISVDLLGGEEAPLKISAILESTGSEMDASDSTSFNGVNDRDASIDLGLQMSYAIGAGSVNGSLTGDVSSTHKGYGLDVNYSHNIPLFGGHLQPAAGFEFKSANYTDYYYGVSSSETATGRAAYKAGSAINPYLSYSYFYPINENLSLIHNTSITFLDSEIKDSPLVDRSNTWSSFVGVGYKF